MSARRGTARNFGGRRRYTRRARSQWAGAHIDDHVLPGELPARTALLGPLVADLIGDAYRPRPLGHFDDIVVGLVIGFQAGGSGVPQDIAVAGYANGHLAAALNTTTVAGRYPIR
jgi:hypothetical protein